MTSDAVVRRTRRRLSEADYVVVKAEEETIVVKQEDIKQAIKQEPIIKEEDVFGDHRPDLVSDQAMSTATLAGAPGATAIEIRTQPGHVKQEELDTKEDVELETKMPSTRRHRKPTLGGQLTISRKITPVEIQFLAEAKQIISSGMYASVARPRGKPWALFFYDNLTEIWELYRKYAQRGTALSPDMKRNLHARMKSAYDRLQTEKARSFPSSSRAPPNLKGRSKGVRYEELMAVNSNEELEELMQKHKPQMDMIAAAWEQLGGIQKKTMNLQILTDFM